MKLSSIIITTLCVGAAGVITGTLLLAPAKGAKPRSKFARKGQEYKESLLDNFHEFTDFVSHPFENLEDETTRLSKKANSKAKKIKAKVNQQLS